MDRRFGTSAAATTAILITALGAYAAAQHGPGAENKRGHGQMMHGQGEHGGMHGDMMQGGAGCPMAAELADVQIEKTKTGAVIRLSAKNPADVDKVQRMALMAALHFGADAGRMLPPATDPRAAKP
jgi:hypothetical protein